MSSAALSTASDPSLSPSQPLSNAPVSPAVSLKPLLNPLQTSDTPPASTIVEPPRSPNPANPATDEKGTNLDAGVSGAVGGVVGLADLSTSADGGQDSTGFGLSSRIPLVPTSPQSSLPIEQPTLSPLPSNAPMPTTPKARDEPPPVLAAGDIPPAVFTPTAITTEDQEVVLDTVGKDAPDSRNSNPQDILPGAFPTPAGTDFDPIADRASLQAPVAPAIHVDPTPQPPAITADVPMEVDVEGEQEGGQEGGGMEASTSTSNLKRAGDELEGRDNKRAREDAERQGSALSQPLAIPPTIGSAGQAAPAAVLPWHIYALPAPRPGGSTSPLTVAQHKHLLNCVRALKKAKDAFGFLVPVDVALFGIPHYHQVIDKPMDLTTVETKLFVSDPRGPPKDKSRMNKWDTSKGSYNSVSEVVGDVRQIWENTRKFNGPDHIVSQAASRLEDTFEKALNSMPAEPAATPAPLPPPMASPVAGPSSTTPNPRRASISQPPVIRRISEGPDSRPKREIHPPPSKDLAYADGASRKPKRRNDPQLQWASRSLIGFEKSPKYYDAISPFLYPVSQIIAELPAYATIIKRPIDLVQIKERLSDGDYEDVSQVNADLRLMIANAMKFNPPGHAVHQAAQQFLQAWDEKWRTCPPKQEVRDASDDPLADFDADSEEEESPLLRTLLAEKLDVERRIADEKANIAMRKSAKASKAKSKKPSVPRKQSVSKASPGVNGNGHSKKPRKSKDYRDGDEEMDSEEDCGPLTLTQKQELAEKIQSANEATLAQAIKIIQQTTVLGSSDQEIELDIDSLPPLTVSKLYNLVCRGGRKPGRPKVQTVLSQGKKGGRGGTGGVRRKHMNEQEEAERIRKMEEQLQTFEGGPQGYQGGEETDSSEEESSDEE